MRARFRRHVAVDPSPLPVESEEVFVQVYIKEEQNINQLMVGAQKGPVYATISGRE